MARESETGSVSSSVTIQPITRQEGALFVGDRPLGVDLGSSHGYGRQAEIIEQRLTTLQGELKDRAANLYLLTWHGGKIPRGAMLNGQEIGWTQHGIVTSVNGEQLGFYDRLLEFGGDDGQEQLMIVYTTLD